MSLGLLRVQVSALEKGLPQETNLNTPVYAEGTPYQGGYFRVKFDFTEEFPAAPPKCMIAMRPI